MKIIASILAFLVLLLSVQPACGMHPVAAQQDACCSHDDEGCAGDGQEKEQDGCRQCNPFQSCACCAVAVVLPAGGFQLIAQPPLRAKRQWGIRILLLQGNDPAGFWQPPRRG